jgi:hypothetical protein
MPTISQKWKFGGPSFVVSDTAPTSKILKDGFNFLFTHKLFCRGWLAIQFSM